VTLPRGTAKLPILDLGYSKITLKQGSSLALSPQTLNYFGGNTFETMGYTATISDVRLMSTFEGIGVNTPDAQMLNTTTTLGTSVSKTVVGTTINFRATTVNTLFGSNTSLFATLTVVGRDSGARVQIPIEITKIS
jgi:Lhr-like helicase